MELAETVAIVCMQEHAIIQGGMAGFSEALRHHALNNPLNPAPKLKLMTLLLVHNAAEELRLSDLVSNLIAISVLLEQKISKAYAQLNINEIGRSCYP